MAHIVVAGFGKVGRALAPLVLKNGHKITGICRSKKTELDGAELLNLDLADSNDLANIPKDTDLILYTVTPDQRTPFSYKVVYEQILNSLVTFCQRNRPNIKFLFVSSTAVYGQSNGEWVDEQSETQPQTFNGKAIVDAEHRLTASSLATKIVRFSGIYQGVSPRLIRMAEEKEQKELGRFGNRIHLRDVAGSLAFLIEKWLTQECIPDLVLASDNLPSQTLDTLNAIREHLGKDALVHQDGNEVKQTGKRCDNRVLKELGYVFEVSSYREGFQMSCNQ